MVKCLRIKSYNVTTLQLLARWWVFVKDKLVVQQRLIVFNQNQLFPGIFTVVITVGITGLILKKFLLRGFTK